MHFAGNFLGISFDRADAGGSRISIVPGPHCEEVDGQTNLGVAALVADMALAACVRVGLDPATRLATVSLHLQLTGAPLAGALEAAGTSEGVLEGAGSAQRLGRVVLTSGGRATAFGTGAFMVLKPPPGVTLHPVERARPLD